MIRSILLVLLATMAGAVAQPGRGTIVFADFEQIFTNFYQTKLTNNQLKEMADAINRERASMLIVFDQLQQDYSDLRQKVLRDDLTEKEVTQTRLDLDEKLLQVRRQEERITKFNQTQEKRWQEQNKRIRTMLIQEIMVKLSGYIKSRGYLGVVDRSQVNDKHVPTILFYDPEADITAELIKEVNK